MLIACSVFVLLLSIQSGLSNVAVTRDLYGYTDNKEVWRYTFANTNNISVQIITYGGRIAVLNVPDRNGHIEDIVLGFDNLEGFTQKSDPYFGAILGRTANRIGGSKFVVDGVQYNVTANEGRNQLHGGLKGFDKAVWDPYLDGSKLVLSYVSEDGEEGFPGTVLTQVTYELTEHDELVFAVKATTTKPTPINIANHAYFNLAGQASGSKGLFEHVVSLNADSYTITDNESIPTGELKLVEGTKLDFRIPRQLGPLIKERGGYDNNFVVNTYGSHLPVFVSRVDHPQSGRFMEVWSDQPGVQMYTGNGLPKPGTDTPLIGKGGIPYQQYGSLSLETQDFPDAVNHASFPNSVLRPGEIYMHTTIYKFGVNHEVVLPAEDDKPQSNCGSGKHSHHSHHSVTAANSGKTHQN